MYTYSSLKKTFVIFSYLFISTSANLFWGLPGLGGHHIQRQFPHNPIQPQFPQNPIQPHNPFRPHNPFQYGRGGGGGGGGGNGGVGGGIGVGFLPPLPRIGDFIPGFGFSPNPQLPKIGPGIPVKLPEVPKDVPKLLPLVGGILETKYLGKWEFSLEDAGVSAMHLQLMPNDRFVMFDATSLGKSAVELPPDRCRVVLNKPAGTLDCYAHAVEYDIATNKIRTLKVLTNPWCSSGGLAPDGTLINTGGWEEGANIIRYYQSCDTCDWRESNLKLSDVRWYATQTMLPDGSYVLFGGRRAFNYEFIAPEGKPSPGKIDFPFLFDTTDIHENNLYPFIHLAPDGNLFIFANFKSVLFDVRINKIIRVYPDLPGGARNYPGSGSSVILPIDLQNDGNNLDIEVIICGGGQPLAFGKAEKEGIFLPALDTCGRIKVLDPNPKWEIETMPSPRVMSDMLNLPNGDVIILNGAKKGASGWRFADEPVFTPFLYSPYKANGKRFKVLAATTIPRMYHSSAAILPDARVFVAGSNTNPGYLFKNVKFPTELSLEKFSPPYLDPELQKYRPKFTLQNKGLKYGQKVGFSMNIGLPGIAQQKDVTVTIYPPPFTTHGYSMSQRLVVLKITSFLVQDGGNYQVQVDAPTKGEIAPPGYYLMFVNYRGVPSIASWITLQK
ncbi:aldehyde oxidase GLOX1-like [Amaranthus tricolor]|uniref:aldehyde oxidase GLOX1-like n=1 Tax=Amaranthus tricolor TaxID=29722 RepID=UPI002586FC8E|nr:aldehyde oxidase GLOX1-like [Amaranthus tricolor]